MDLCLEDILHLEMECLSTMMKIELDLQITILIYTRDHQIMLKPMQGDKMKIKDLHQHIEIKQIIELFKGKV